MCHRETELRGRNRYEVAVLAGLMMLSNAYDSELGDNNWNQCCDMTMPTGVISMSDLVTFATHCGQHYP